VDKSLSDLFDTPDIQGVFKMAHNIYVMRIYVKYQTKNSNLNLVLDEYFLNYVSVIELCI
jgi:hypothetical protein